MDFMAYTIVAEVITCVKDSQKCQGMQLATLIY